MTEPTKGAVMEAEHPEAALVETRLVCGDCGHELEDDEVDEQREEIKEHLSVEGPHLRPPLDDHPRRLTCHLRGPEELVGEVGVHLAHVVRPAVQAPEEPEHHERRRRCPR